MASPREMKLSGPHERRRGMMFGTPYLDVLTLAAIPICFLLFCFVRVDSEWSQFDYIFIGINAFVGAGIVTVWIAQDDFFIFFWLVLRLPMGIGAIIGLAYFIARLMRPKRAKRGSWVRRLGFAVLIFAGVLLGYLPFILFIHYR
jgi:hypothetical protein